MGPRNEQVIKRRNRLFEGTWDPTTTKTKKTHSQFPVLIVAFAVIITGAKRGGGRIEESRRRNEREEGEERQWENRSCNFWAQKRFFLRKSWRSGSGGVNRCDCDFCCAKPGPRVYKLVCRRDVSLCWWVWPCMDQRWSSKGSWWNMQCVWEINDAMSMSLEADIRKTMTAIYGESSKIMTRTRCLALHVLNPCTPPSTDRPREIVQCRGLTDILEILRHLWCKPEKWGELVNPHITCVMVQGTFPTASQKKYGS